MSTPAANTIWSRLARLRPRLKAATQITRQVYRGAPWYVLRNPLSGQQYRVTADVHRLLVALDGERTLEEAITELSRAGHPVPGAEDLELVVARLRAASLVDLRLRPDTAALLDRVARERRSRRLAMALRPFSVRLPLTNPDALLGRLTPWFGWFFGPVGLVLWACLAVTAAVLVVGDWRGLLDHASSRMTDPGSLVLLYAVYPLIKLVHELGHGIAAKRRGGEVHELGIMFLVFIPIPYVDASSASMFPRKGSRAMVGAAGVMVETVLAALALVVWSNAEPGFVRDLAFNVVFIAGISSIAFNGNPLLRFDGYYVLADLLEIPGLATRANQYFGYLTRRYLFGLDTAASPVSAPGERGWFLAYAPAAFAYRIFMVVSIIVMLMSTVPAVGTVLAVWAAASLALWPLVRQFVYLSSSGELTGHRTRAMTVAIIALVGLLGAAHWVPIPMRTGLAGVVRLPTDSQVRASADGFVARVVQPSGAIVRRGDPLVELDDPQLESRIRSLEGRVAELRGSWLRERSRTRAGAGVQAEELGNAIAALDQARTEADRLRVASPRDGRISMLGADDLSGRFVSRGDLLGYVSGDDPVIVRVAVPQSDIDLVRGDTRRIEVRLAHAPDRVFTGRLLSDGAAGGTELQSPLLGSQRGGSIAVDAREASGTLAIEPVFELDVQLEGMVGQRFSGGRAYVRLYHGARPFSWRLGRSVRQLFLLNEPG